MTDSVRMDPRLAQRLDEKHAAAYTQMRVLARGTAPLTASARLLAPALGQRAAAAGGALH